MEYHKHSGVLSNGQLKSHPVERQHSDKKVQHYHDLAITTTKSIKHNVPLEKAKQEIRKENNKIVSCQVDNSRFININLAETPSSIVGIRLKFTRNEGRTLRTIALQINK